MKKTKKTEIAYIYWLAIFLGLGGIHRFYAGKPITGLIWLLSGGLLGIGQLFDLLILPKMIQSQNLEFEDRVLEYEVN